MQGKAKAWVLASRPKTLPAALIPVWIGFSLSWEIQILLIPALLCLGFAVLIQIGTNFANDYYDFKSGADGKERKGPPRAVASGWIAPSTMFKGTMLTFAAAFLMGLGLIPYGGWILLIVGVVSILCGLAYTGGPYPLGYNGLGDLFVFLFFGWVATLFTFYLQTGSFTIGLGISGFLRSFGLWLAGSVPGALAVNLLIINNLRDRDEDLLVGKKTLAVRFGRTFSLAQFILLNTLSYTIPIMFFCGGYQLAILLPLICLPIGIWQTIRFVRARSVGDFNASLALTALHLMLFGLLFGFGLILGVPNP